MSNLPTDETGIAKKVIPVLKLFRIKYTIGLLFCLLVTISSCTRTRNKQSVKVISLTANKKITQFNDTTFFRKIYGMTRGRNYTYMFDRTHIYQLDSNMNLKRKFGRQGKGPGEFINIGDISFADDSLYIDDKSQYIINVFDKNARFVREIKLPNISTSYIAADANGHIFLSSPWRDHLITELNAHGHVIRTFGQNTVKKGNLRRNARMLFVYNGKLIAVGISEPVVSVFHLNGMLINKTRISPPLIKKYIKNTERENTTDYKRKNAVVFTYLFMDAAMYKNKLYLMLPARGERPNFTYVFKYKLEPNGSLIYKMAFKLYRPNHKKRLVGAFLAPLGPHKLVLFDVKSRWLYAFKNKNL